MVVYAHALLRKGVAVVADERFCGSVEHDRKRAFVNGVAYLVHIAPFHKGKPLRRVAHGIYVFVGEVVFQRVFQPDLTSHCVAVGIGVAVDNYRVVSFDGIKCFAFHIISFCR